MSEATASAPSTQDTSPAIPAADEQPSSSPAGAATPVQAQPAAVPQPEQHSAAAEVTKVASDSVADAMAELNKLKREASKKHESLVESEKKHASRLALADSAEKARAALASKDFAAALQILAGEGGLDLDEASVLLLEQATQRDSKPMTREEIERVASEKYKAEKAAEEAAAKERNAASLSESKAMFGNTVADVYKQNATKYPMISNRGIDDVALFEWVIPQIQARGGVAPSPSEVLDHFEAKFTKQFEKEASAMGYTKAQIAAAKQEMKEEPAAKTPIPSLDTKGAASERKDTGKRESLAEMAARHKAALRAG